MDGANQEGLSWWAEAGADFPVALMPCDFVKGPPPLWAPMCSSMQWGSELSEVHPSAGADVCYCVASLFPFHLKLLRAGLILKADNS